MLNFMKSLLSRSFFPIWTIALLAIVSYQGVGFGIDYVTSNYAIVVKETAGSLESGLRNQTPSFSRGIPYDAVEAPCDSILESIPASKFGSDCYWAERKAVPPGGGKR